MRSAVLLFVLALFLFGGPARALDPAVKCQADKKKLAGQYAKCLLKAYAKSDKRGEAPDFSRCEKGFSDKWAKIEERGNGSCPATSDELTVKNNADVCAIDISNLLPRPKTVFVTSEAYSPGGTGPGRFDSPASADAHCQALAEAAERPLAVGGSPVFKAWVSDSSVEPADGTRFTQSIGPYALVGGTQIAPNWAGLIDGTLDAPINVNENGALLVNPANVWTATGSNGGFAADGCSDWQSSAGFPDSAGIGKTDATDALWTLAYPLTCDLSARFYCFEQ